MTNWQLQLPTVHNHNGTSTNNFSVLCGTSASKSSWAEDIASTEFDYYGFWLQFKVVSYSGYLWSMDIGIGAASSEIAILEEFMIPRLYQSYHYGTGSNIFVPLFIPAGTRVSTRGRSSHTSAYSIYGSFCGVVDNPMMPVFGRSQWMNVNTSYPKGRDVDPGTTANTWGSWTALDDGPLAFDARYVICLTTSNDTARSTANFNMQLGLGSSGNEVSIAEWISYTHSSADFQGNWAIGYPVHIPAGTTISNRAKCNITTAGDRIVNCSYHFFG